MLFFAGQRTFYRADCASVLNATLMADYGRSRELNWTPVSGLHLEAAPARERDPIRVEIGSYEIARRDGVAFFTINKLRPRVMDHHAGSATAR